MSPGQAEIERGDDHVFEDSSEPIGTQMLIPEKFSTVLFDGSTHSSAGSSDISSGVRTAEP